MYKKPNHDPLYVKKNWNQPSTIINQISAAIGKRISDVSSNNTIFTKSILFYENTSKNVHTMSLKCNPTQQYSENEDQSKQRKQKKSMISYAIFPCKGVIVWGKMGHFGFDQKKWWIQVTLKTALRMF